MTSIRSIVCSRMLGRMKLFRRYVIGAFFVTVVTLTVTVYVYVRASERFDGLHTFQRGTGTIKRALIFNRNKDAVFYNITLRSHLYDRIMKINRKKISMEAVDKILEQRESLELTDKHQISVVLSDLIAVNRPVPDSRPNGCSSIEYPKDLPTVSIVIPFHNEWPSILIRTIYSIINRTPKHLLKEIILVDDASEIHLLYSQFEKELKHHFPGSLVKLTRLQTRSGLIVARLEGLKLVTAETVSFFDSHMEVNKNWLPPLLAEVKKNPKTIAMAQLDYINRKTFAYEYEDGYRTRYGFDWRLIFFETYFRADQLDGKAETDPLPGVVMVGPGFVVNVKFFKDIGAYDDQMKIWGGENLEFPWRVWMCGGQLIHVPCSRIGHIARPQPYEFPEGRSDTEFHNYKRAVEVWMGDHKKYVYAANQHMKDDVTSGDISERLALKDKLECKSFKWYLDTIWPELLTYEEDTLAYGAVKNTRGELCLDNTGYLFSVASPIALRPCSGDVQTQMFALDLEGRLRTILQCIVVTGSYISEKVVSMQGCFEGPTEVWIHSGPGTIKHQETGLCMEMTKLGELIMSVCDETSQWQRWTFPQYFPGRAKQS